MFFKQYQWLWICLNDLGLKPTQNLRSSAIFVWCENLQRFSIRKVWTWHELTLGQNTDTLSGQMQYLCEIKLSTLLHKEDMDLTRFCTFLSVTINLLNDLRLKSYQTFRSYAVFLWGMDLQCFSIRHRPKTNFANFIPVTLNLSEWLS